MANLHNLPVEIIFIILSYLQTSDLISLRSTSKRYADIITEHIKTRKNIYIKAVCSIFPFHIIPANYISQHLMIIKISENVFRMSMGKCSAYMFFIHHHGLENASEWDQLQDHVKKNTKLQVKAVRATYAFLMKKSKGEMAPMLQHLIAVHANFKVLRHDKNFLLRMRT